MRCDGSLQIKERREERRGEERRGEERRGEERRSDVFSVFSVRNIIVTAYQILGKITK
jgi:hypothetical protein